VPAEIAACGGAGGMQMLPNFSSLSLDDQVRLVEAAWQSPLPRLLVFDNCEDEALLQQYRPPSGGCRVLVTSRRVQWQATLGVRALPLGVLKHIKSVKLLCNYRTDLPLDNSGLHAIAHELGDLPLALHLAGSFLKLYKNDTSPAEYLAELQASTGLQHESFEGEGISPTGHDQNVARTFKLSYDRLQATDPTDAIALQLLARAAYFASGEPIPRDLMKATLNIYGDDKRATRQATKALQRLINLGLLEEAEGALRLHRLLAAFVRAIANDAEAQATVEDVMLHVAEHLNGVGDPRPLLVLQPHLRAITAAAQQRKDEQAANLCFALGYHFTAIGNYSEARIYYEQTLAIRQQILGTNHPDTAVILNDLGYVLQAQGNNIQAQDYFEQALIIREQVLGAEHTRTAQSLNNLGFVLQAQGNYAKAWSYYNQALAIREKELGIQHADTATTLNNLGYLLQAQGNNLGAQPYFERALSIREQVLGTNHPRTAESMNNLGMVYHAQDNLLVARHYLERALAIQEQVLGPMHPDTATSLNKLGMVLYAQRDYAGARQYYERALEIMEQLLGPMHPNTAWSLINLGYLLTTESHYAEAREFYERALAIREQALGQEHRDTAASLHDLGHLLQTQGDYEGAQRYYKRSLSIRERVLGLTHVDTAHTQNNLGLVYLYQGIFQAAVPLMQQALSTYEVILGFWHPNTQALRQTLTVTKQNVKFEQRVQTVVEQASVEGSPEEQAALVDRLEIAATAFAGGQTEGSPWLVLAERLRALAERLKGE
jgi:tetratricopeptide (TPR) repeat protein